MNGLSTRLFLLNDQDGIYLLPYTQFEHMCRTPQSHRMAHFAGARVRMAEVIVALQNRQSVRVIRRVFGTLPFDRTGNLDKVAYIKEADDRIKRALPMASTAGLQSGDWVPSKILVDRLDRAALGLERCPRLRADP